MAAELSNSISSERAYDPENEIRQLEDRSEYELPLKYFNVAERYVEGRLFVVVFFCIAGKAEKCIALFQNANRIDKGDCDRFIFGNAESGDETFAKQFVGCGRIEPISYAAGTVYLCKDQDMFVRNIHPVETPQRIISTEVRLVAIDKTPIGGTHPLCFSRRIGRVSWGALGYREVCVGCDCSPIVNDESRSQVIQGGAEIVNDVADNETDERIDINHILDDIVGVSGLRIVLGADFARIRCQKGFTSRLKISDVAFGPLDLQFC